MPHGFRFTEAEVKDLRQKYKEKRIRLTQMPGDLDPLPMGSLGTCWDVDDAGQLLMNWDCGRSISLIPGIDQFEIHE